MFMKSLSLTSLLYAFQQRNRRENIDEEHAVKVVLQL